MDACTVALAAVHVLTAVKPLTRHNSRSVEVELTSLLTFHMQEALFQRRPDHWASIWPTSLAVSRWLLEQLPASLPSSGKELGCGLGLVSMTMAHLGILTEGTDREPAALALATSNAQRNALVGFSVSHLDWSEPQGAATAFMVASDVLYERGSQEHLFELLRTSGLLVPSGRLVVAGPRSRMAPVKELVARLQDQGYSHQEEMRVVQWRGHTDEVDVHVLVRPA